MSFRKKAREAIKSRMNISSLGCWEYSLKIRPNGYARITFMGESWYAHRLAFFAFNGELIDGLDVCHSCDNRKCVNPNHLSQGTRKENMQDCVSKGRHATGFRLPQTKLSEVNKKEIMQLVMSGEKYPDIARNFNVSRQLVGKIAIKGGVRIR